jgi:DNA-binding protein H-NS
MNIEQLNQKRDTLVAEVESELDQFMATENARVIERVRQMMADYGIPIDALVNAMKMRLGKKPKEPVVPPKYRNPKTGKTWSGRGRAPLSLAGVKSRDKFLIEQ